MREKTGNFCCCEKGAGHNIDVENDLVKCRDAENEIVRLLLSLMIDIYEKLCC